MDQLYADGLFSNEVALITGGGTGIGLAAATEMGLLGAKVAICGRRPEPLRQAVAALESQGIEAYGAPCDIREADAISEYVDSVLDRFERIDILVNNAGGTARKPFLNQSERSWRRHIDLNLVSVLAATSAVAPIMIEGGRGGSIINISSIEGTRAAPEYAVYAACKAAVLNLTRTLALEFADHGIRVNALTPDYIDTPGLRGNVTGPVDPATWLEPGPAQQAATARRIPLGRPGHAEECAAAALFLASDLASYLTGVTLPVDGGCSASSGWLRDSTGRWTLTGDIPPDQD